MTSMTLALRLLGAAAFAGLAACQTTGTATNGSPAGVPITVDIVDGAPQRVKTAFASEIYSAAAAKKVDLVQGDSQARYQVRGHLSTNVDAAGSSTVAVVWDVFDTEKRRARRLTGSSPIRAGAQPHSWQGLDKETLAKLAASSMDEIAAFLAEAKQGGGTLVADAGAAGPGFGLQSASE